mmetsp:Transcript_41078/g.85527  ORF Transcript_41078/g.85527 Transcript_41078/m.85527 type:complete len:98 (-) Transcript_41078:38-331(-)
MSLVSVGDTTKTSFCTPANTAVNDSSAMSEQVISEKRNFHHPKQQRENNGTRWLRHRMDSTDKINGLFKQREEIGNQVRLVMKGSKDSRCFRLLYCY